jgi:hypothetical protein
VGLSPPQRGKHEKLEQRIERMENDPAALLKILSVSHEASFRGTGLSLEQAIADSHYLELRPHFSAEDLVFLLEARPALVEAWLQYSRDKRTDTGWYLLESGEIGRRSSGETFHFRTLHSAAAHYAVRELDFWSGYQGHN